MEGDPTFGPSGGQLAALARTWAPPRPTRLPIDPGPVPGPLGLAPELGAWIEQFATHALELADPAEAELRAPGDLPSLGALLDGTTGPSTLADLFGLFTASTVVAQIDGLALLASLAGTASGHCRIYGFHPEDWGVFPSAPALSVALTRLEDRAGRARHPFGSGVRPRPDPDLLERAEAYAARVDDEALPGHLDPARLARRADWLVRALAGLPFGPETAAAPPAARWEAEYPLLRDHPHLHRYWLLAAALDGDRARFEATASVVPTRPDRWLDEARTAASAWLAGYEAQLGPLDRARFTRLQAERTAADAPAPAPTQPSHRFFELLEHLRSGREPGPEPWRGLPPERLEGELSRLAETGHRAALDAAIAEGRGLPDTHPRAGRGYLVARAALASDLHRFLAVAPGPGPYGPRRRDEWWRAVASFEGPDATARLAEGAAAFAREAADWIRTASKVPWDALLARDGLATHDLVAAFAAAAPTSPPAAPLWVEAAEAAVEHRITRAAPGIRRAVAAGVGRVDDGARVRLAEATAALDREAVAFLGAVARALRLDWESAEEQDDAERRAAELACVVGPLLSLDPSSEWTALGAALFRTFLPELAPGRRCRPRTLEALAALVRGARRGDAGALRPTVAALGTLWRGAERSAHPAGGRLDRALASPTER